MPRVAAAALLASAAIDWPGWWLDRAGVALLGLACLALALPAPPRRRRAGGLLAGPLEGGAAGDDLEPELGGLEGLSDLRLARARREP